jgi:hypothetical protein
VVELLRLQIRYEFIRSHVRRLTWRELRFGMENELLDSTAPVKMAMQRICENPSAPSLEVELAGLDEQEYTKDLVSALADSEPADTNDETRDLWLYLVLAWLHDHRDELADPLMRVEEVAENFDYPESMTDMVDWTPRRLPDPGRLPFTDDELLEGWKRYLESAAAKYGA